MILIQVVCSEIAPESESSDKGSLSDNDCEGLISDESSNNGIALDSASIDEECGNLGSNGKQIHLRLVLQADILVERASRGDACYVLTLPLLFLIPHHPFTLLPTRLLIPGTALLWSLASLTLFLLIPLISSLTLPPNPLPFAPLCVAGHILLTALPTFTPDALMETPQSSGLPPEGILLMLILWNTQPSVESTFA
jgi:hypothetical protein